jgi:porphobilinogen synthase
MQPTSPREDVTTGESIAARPRRLRSLASLRELVSESEFRTSQLVAPLFVADDPDRPGTATLPALARRSPDDAAEAVSRLRRSGVGSVILFGVPSRKDAQGSPAWDPRGPVPRAIRAIKERDPEATVIADVCLCEYTDHGHCGVLRGPRIDNDRTLPLLGRAATAYADAGADLVAPSAMMDHQVAAIRAALDRAGHGEVGILAYAAKFSSSFYGPFRDAAGSAPAFGDRRSYQMDGRNRREALRELALDAAEGADVLMVKPALPYLDVIAAARERFDLPIAAYQVSGEYAMIKAAAARGWLDESAAARETLGAIHRAGASVIISYFASELERSAKGRT